MCSPINAYQETVKKFVSLAPEEMVGRSGARFDKQRQRFEVMYFGSLYMADREGKVWRADDPATDVPYNDKTLILQYLCEASGLPPRGVWLSFLELPDGAHHYRPLQVDATEPLARVFGSRPKDFVNSALSLGGRPAGLGEYSFIIPALPKIPLAVVLWEDDDEFPASSNILYDSVSPTHLTTAALWVLGVELSHKLISRYDRKAGREREITWLEGVKKD